MKQSILEEHQVVFLHTSTTHGQGQVKQSDSRAYADELGALAGWCTLLQRCPQRRDLSLRLSLATVSSLAEAARRNYICKHGLQSDNWLEGQAGKDSRSEEAN